MLFSYLPVLSNYGGIIHELQTVRTDLLTNIHKNAVYGRMFS